MITLERDNTTPTANEINQMTKKKTKMFVSVKEFSNLTGIKEHSVRVLLKIEGFPAMKIGVKYMVLVEEAMQWLRLNSKILANGRSRAIV